MGRSIGLVLAAMAFVVVGCSDGDEEADVLGVVEDFTAAVNAYDTEAIRESVTEDFTWQSTGPVQTLDEYAAYVSAYYESGSFNIEVTEDLVVSADGGTYSVEEIDVVTGAGLDPNGVTGVLAYRVVEVGGRWLISEARWTETPAQ